MSRLLSRITQAAGEHARRPDGHLLDTFLTRADEAAFGELVRRHGPMVLAVCRRVLGHHQDAEDAFQATFLVLARRAAAVWPQDAVGSWLHGVARRVALKARGARARRRGREQPLDGADSPAPAVETFPDLVEALDRAIQQLPEVYRVAVVTCDLEGKPRKVAAKQLGWKEGTLSGRLARARELLAARLRRVGFTLPAGGVAAVLCSGATADAVPPGLLDQVAAFVADHSAAGVSAPIVALTEGVVRSMFLTKLKTAVVCLVACTFGLGAWAAAGAGDGPGESPTKNTGRPRVDKAGTGPGAQRIDLTAAEQRRELAIQELKLFLLADAAQRLPTTPREFRLRLDRNKARLDAIGQLLEEAEKELDKETARANGEGTAERLAKEKAAADRLKAAEVRVRLAGVEVDLANAGRLQAQVQLDLANARLKQAKANLAAAKKAVRSAEK